MLTRLALAFVLLSTAAPAAAQHSNGRAAAPQQAMARLSAPVCVGLLSGRPAGGKSLCDSPGTALRRPQALRQASSAPRSWIARHPVLFGTMLGFGSGFLVGYTAGDDGVFDDFTAGFNGVVLGGIGAGVGAAVGGVIGR